MALSCGIVGLPNVGKSTIFNALTRSTAALATSYPFASADPTVGDVAVPDPRLDILAEIVEAKRIVHATMRFVDIAGLGRGASTGAGLGNAFLSHIREVDAIAMVVRCFRDPDVPSVEGTADPSRDIEIVSIEMALADLATLAKRVERLEREARGDAAAKQRLASAQRLSAALEAGTPARSFAADSPEAQMARESFLLTAKPLVYVANIDEADIAEAGPLARVVFDVAAREGSKAIAFCGKVEAELGELSVDEARSFASELGIERGALDQLILASYDALDLMTFLTAGPKEARAWTIQRGTKAPQAAGKIHSDLERGFIRAEIVSYDDYARLRSMEALRTAGLVRSEGRDYIMREGDVVNFRFNV
ncbi:MAG: redox-regulated ATPase YchF [Candidatus Eremiobacteraeota bacterium]|nr:redox-regulated ATPase YchF [Candidatus Eremiobacteraeota bacterium]